MKIELVDTNHVQRVWPMVETFFVSALEHSKGDYTAQDARTLLALGQWHLIVAVDDSGVHGAAAVTFNNRPADRVAFITAIGGKLISNKDTFAQLKQVLANVGATCIEGAARESVARLWSRYGFEEKYRIVGVKL